MERRKKKRKNGTGSPIYLGNCRYEPWAARIVIGKDYKGTTIYFDIDTFETELDALVCLENYHKNPYPLKIKQQKYDRIVTFSKQNYPLVPVENITAEIHRKNKKNYTFKQVFEELKECQFPTKEEIKLEKTLHIKPQNKFSYSTAHHIQTAYNQCPSLHDRIYCELKTSDYKSCINSPDVKRTVKIEMIKLFKKMDQYAYSEDIIDKKYSEDLKYNIGSKNRNRRMPFTYKEIDILWKIEENDNFGNQFVRDFLLLSCYTGCRADELLLIYTENIHLDENYFITGLKTDAGINREIPIHKNIKSIFEKYYNKNNTFLFESKPNQRRSYNSYNQLYQEFIKKYTELKGKTAHCGRHSLETELQKLNVKSTIINAILGHSNGNVADDVYNHISLEEKIAAINLVTYKETKLYILDTQKLSRQNLEKTI